MGISWPTLYANQPVSPHNDPWEPLHSLRQHGKHVLTSVEFTMTNLCNMRCEHCAVGDSLTYNEPVKWPLADVLRRLDEVEHLQTISITGGEPSFHRKTVDEYIIPLLQYARSRGVKSQLNSNLTLDLERYEQIAPWLDVMHISFNYTDVEDFLAVGFSRANHDVPLASAMKMYERMIENTRKLIAGGLFISAESMINYRTHLKLPRIHQLIVEMGCLRHEVHPMYPSSFARDLPVLSLSETKAAVERLLDSRNPDIWMLFGTLPLFQCSSDASDRALLERLRKQPNVTVRNDPDGRNRLNVNLFDGNVYVTDFSDLSAVGNIATDSLDQVFERWTSHRYHQQVNCYCPAADCCGPNLLVVDTYYRDVDFKSRNAIF
jgi:radical SAM/CxCxxxxC motif protein YfkAB